MRGLDQRTSKEKQIDFLFATARALEDKADELQLEAERLRRKATRLEDGDVVQVRFPRYKSHGQTYAYKVPDGLTVSVGDLVVVESLYGGQTVVEVVSVGRGGYEGPLKSITGKVQILKVDDDA